MESIKLFSYNPKNWNQILDSIKDSGSKVYLLTSQDPTFQRAYKEVSENQEEEIRFPVKERYIDLSLVMAGAGERVDLWAVELLPLLNLYFQAYNRGEEKRYFMVDKKYAKDISIVLYYYIDGVESIEKLLEIDKRIVTNIVDIEEAQVDLLQAYLQENLFGNSKFKARLIEELKRFRLFNKIDERKVFSAFICGPSGIGKTLTAKLLHDYLSPGESYIKINLGNYSDHNALSSLIGSPRGYIGSSKGELSGKVSESKSTVILIDEFEKASQEVHNFFLELLADGKFTDSQGREYDLNKYVIVFTSNIDEEDYAKHISPELRSRFDLSYRMVLLTDEEKLAYVKHKADYYATKIKEIFNMQVSSADIVACVTGKISSINNIRFITREIERSVAKLVETNP